MRKYLTLAMLLAIAASAGCQSTGGVAYGPPCGPSAADAGYCPHVGYRKPVQI